MSSHYRRARALAEVRRWPEAEAAVRSGLAGEPADAGLLVLLSFLLRMQRDYPAALAAADAAAAADPALAGAQVERAESLLALLRDDDAVAAAREAARLAPAQPAGHLVLARALASARRFDRARAAARHALTLAPGTVECLLTVAEVERAAGNRPLAEEFARAALAIDPAHAYGRWLLAVLDAEGLRVGRSMRGLREMARDHPAHPDVLTMTWPIRGLLAALRAWLPVATGLVVLLTLGAIGWPPLAFAGRLLAVLFAATVVLLAGRVLLPAGRLPWRCLRLVPRPVRRATTGGLVTVVAILILLLGYAGTGSWWLPAVALAGALALWAAGSRRVGGRPDF